MVAQIGLSGKKSDTYDIYSFAFNSPDMKIGFNPTKLPKFMSVTYLRSVSVSTTGPPAPN